MGNIIKSIVLSSGTVVNIAAFPIIPYTFSDRDSELKIYSRGDTCLLHRNGMANIQWQRFSDDDLLELGNILMGASCTTLIKEYPPSQSQWVSFLYWAYNPNDNKWYLCHSYDKTNDTNMTLEISNQDKDEGYFSTRYFNGENTHAEGDFRDYYYTVHHLNPAIPNQCYNVRSGPIYTLDIGCNYFPAYAGGHQRSVSQIMTNIERYMNEHPDADITIIGYDPETNDDPFIIDDPSTFGGGDGSGDDPDAIEKMPIPDLPTLSAVDTGLVTLYTATNAQLQSLGGYLWSSLWDIETNFKKLFSDPMNCLVGLSIVPVTPSAGGAVNVKFGNITTNIALNVLASQYVEVDCGSVAIKEYIGSFLDYSPYVNISIYLPYVGYRELSPDDVMNDTIHVVYHVDVLSGGCCAMIETSKKGLLYSFNGSCITNVPITAINYSGAIQNAVSAVGAGLTTVAGIATGTAPLTAVGATQMLQSASNTAMNSKPTIQRSGAMGGAAGLMSCQKPFLVITRPRMSVPDKLNKFVGLTTNVTMKLSQVKGFTQVEHVHLSGIAATEDEKQELMTLLRQGVIF